MYIDYTGCVVVEGSVTKRMLLPACVRAYKRETERESARGAYTTTIYKAMLKIVLK